MIDEATNLLDHHSSEGNAMMRLGWRDRWTADSGWQIVKVNLHGDVIAHQGAQTWIRDCKMAKKS